MTLDLTTTGYGSHLPVLVHYFNRTAGPVLEVGAGLWSTPVLARLCGTTGRAFSSIEDNADVRGQLELDPFVEEWHWASDLAQKPGPDRYAYGLALVDCAPRSARAAWVDRLRGVACAVLLHDSEHIDEAYPELHKATLRYKYRREWTERLPHTLALSETMEL